MVLPVLAVIGGLVLLTWSADRFVFGASAFARSVGVSALLVGLTIVAFGTSAPEIVVSVLATLQGNPGLAVGNAIGSNIANIGLVLAMAALVAPLVIGHGLVRRELPILMVVSLAVLFLLLDGELGRLEGGLLISGLLLVTAWVIHIARRAQALDPADAPEEVRGMVEAIPAATSTGRALAWLGLGLALLIASSQLVVWGAVGIAEQLGISDLVIGLTIVAIGTSLPELATSLVAAFRREAGLAIGNVIGSNLFNLLAVLAVPALIAPLAIEPEVLVRDYPVMLGMTVALFVFALARGSQLRRWQGGLLLAVFAGYLVHLGMTATA
ncbi:MULTISPECIES: calcium/sodium antiporter [unclassified Thioalkalivibrio]|uniref:calcium/sodium antiporter n=1 Tax=unclassified Thioalkalivibrio TaxID=2621013 RepID=UPI0003815B78|nr:MULTISPECIES: calcium/sodium antiporter [unclassified Thioalkalivibrio]